MSRRRRLKPAPDGQPQRPGPRSQPPLFAPAGQAGQDHEAQARPAGGRSISDQTKQMMLAMLDLGLDKRAIGALLDIAGYRKAHLDYVLGPIITHRTPWSADLPAWLYPAIYKDRLELIFAEHDAGNVGELATLSEVLAVLMPATAEAPLSHEWVNVHTWVAQRVYDKHRAPVSGVTFAEAMDGDVVAELSDFERKEHLHRLQYDIRRKVVQAARARERQERRQAGRSGKQKRTERTARRRPEVVQLDLFAEAE